MNRIPLSMPILYLSPRPLWPPDTGARLRDFHLARHLARHHPVLYLGMSEAPAPSQIPPPQSGQQLDVRSWSKEPSYSWGKILRGLVGPLPVTLRNYWSPAGARELAALLEQVPFDTVQIEGVHLFPFLDVLSRFFPRQRILADWHNLESELLFRYAAMHSNPLRRLAARRTAALLERCEAALLQQAGQHTVTSAREAQQLRLRAPDARVEVIPNGVDLDFFQPAADPPPWESRTSLVFVGSLDYHANIDAALWLSGEIWPRVRAQCSGARLALVGRNPPPSVRRLAASDILVTGTVADVRPFYHQARLALAPLRIGSGTRLKILEAMAMNIPVVSTPLGAEGIPALAGEHFLQAASPQDFAEAVVQLWHTPSAAQRLARQAFAFVHEHFSWSAIGLKLLQIHEQAASRPNV